MRRLLVAGREVAGRSMLSVAQIVTPFPVHTTEATRACHVFPAAVRMVTVSPALTAPSTVAPQAPVLSLVGLPFLVFVSIPIAYHRRMTCQGEFRGNGKIFFARVPTRAPGSRGYAIGAP